MQILMHAPTSNLESATDNVFASPVLSGQADDRNVLVPI